MDYEAFIVSTLCKPLILAEEDQPQDVKEWKRLLDSDRRKQFERYIALNQPTTIAPATDEEKRVIEQLAKLTKKNLSGGDGTPTTPAEMPSNMIVKSPRVSMAGSGSSAPPAQNFDRNAYQREYMRKQRAAKKLKEKK